MDQCISFKEIFIYEPDLISYTVHGLIKDGAPIISSQKYGKMIFLQYITSGPRPS